MDFRNYFTARKKKKLQHNVYTNFHHTLNVLLYNFVEFKSGLGFCHGKKYFCQDSGKNRQKLAKTMVQ